MNKIARNPFHYRLTVGQVVHSKDRHTVEGFSSETIFVSSADKAERLSHALSGAISPRRTVQKKALTSGVATLTLPSHDFAVGDIVIVDINDVIFDGIHQITAIGPNTVSYAKVNSDIALANTSGGIRRQTTKISGDLYVPLGPSVISAGTTIYATLVKV